MKYLYAVTLRLEPRVFHDCGGNLLVSSLAPPMEARLWIEYMAVDGATESAAETILREWIATHRPRVEVVDCDCNPTLPKRPTLH